MTVEKNTLTLDDIAFPEIPGGAVEEADLLRLIAAAYGALETLYEGILASSEGEKHLLVRLLGGDWRNLSASVRHAVSVEVAALEESDSTPAATSCPPEEDIAKIVEHLNSLELADLVPSVDAIVRRCLICTRLIPLAITSPHVRTLFVSCVDAEDKHLAQIAWLKDILGS